MKGQNFIIFSSINWSTHWQIHHQLVNSIIEAGGRVLFVENTGVRSPKIRDFGRIVDRIKDRVNSTHGYKDVEKDITILTPVFSPYPFNKLSIFMNTLFISGSIKKWIKVSNFYNPICISFLPTPAIQRIIKSINPSLEIYYCADDMSRSLSDPNKIKKYENIFFKDADLVFVTSHRFFGIAKQFNDVVYNIPSGIDESKFPPKNEPSVPDDIKTVKHPIIGYTGAISDVFDQELILRLADYLPEINIVLVGPKFVDIAQLKSRKNIIILDEREHSLMPSYINSFDVALIPYVVNEATDSVYSCKLNEYLALGRAVLSTNLKEIRIFNEKNNNLIEISVDSDDFIEKAKVLINNSLSSSEVDRINRINIAKENTWKKRFLEIDMAIKKALDLKLNEKNGWKKRLINTYNSAYYLFIKRISFFAVLYLLFFHSPLFWFMGERLILKDFPKKSDAIVVFSGDGEVSYRNLSYQKRSLDAIKLYNEGYSDKIFLSSGRRQTIADVDIIRMYLINKGIPESSIFILKSYPNSTFQNINMVSKALSEHDIDSILFLTAPYHTARSVMLWNLNVPNIHVTTPDFRNLLSRNIHWGIGLDKMRIITYEYFSIVYNWALGRL